MTMFDKICAAFTIAVGCLFMIMGVVGLFIGVNASFKLSPILGFLPFFLGWGMCVPLVKYWRLSGKLKRQASEASESSTDIDA